MNNERKVHKGHIAMCLDKGHTRLLKQIGSSDSSPSEPIEWIAFCFGSVLVASKALSTNYSPFYIFQYKNCISEPILKKNLRHILGSVQWYANSW